MSVADEVWKARYLERTAALRADVGQLIELERRAHQFLLDAVMEDIDAIDHTFSDPERFLRSWVATPPEQRGKAATGVSVPWSETAERAVAGNLWAFLRFRRDGIVGGLPFGADITFKAPWAYLNLDVKATGNDSYDNVVASVNQLSGDGRLTDDGRLVQNSIVRFIAPSGLPVDFWPKLPPYYLADDLSYEAPCVTSFIKVHYELSETFGVQRLASMELATVPNGLLFDCGWYQRGGGLMGAGKDGEESKPVEARRARVYLPPLARLDDGFRCTKIVRDPAGGWKAEPRDQQLLLDVVSIVDPAFTQERQENAGTRHQARKAAKAAAAKSTTEPLPQLGFDF